jgi:hypothetical protein
MQRATPRQTQGPRAGGRCTLALWLAACALAGACDPVWKSPFTVRVSAEVQRAYAPRLPAYLLIKKDQPIYEKTGGVIGTVCAAADTAFVAHYDATAIGCAKEVGVVAWLLPVPAEERSAVKCGPQDAATHYASGPVPTDAPQARGRAFPALPCQGVNAPAQELVLHQP